MSRRGSIRSAFSRGRHAGFLRRPDLAEQLSTHPLCNRRFSSAPYDPSPAGSSKAAPAVTRSVPGFAPRCFGAGDVTRYQTEHLAEAGCAPHSFAIWRFHSAIKLVKMRLWAHFSFIPTNLPTTEICMLVDRRSGFANSSYELHIDLMSDPKGSPCKSEKRNFSGCTRRWVSSLSIQSFVESLRGRLRAALITPIRWTLRALLERIDQAFSNRRQTGVFSSYDTKLTKDRRVLQGAGDQLWIAPA